MNTRTRDDVDKGLLRLYKLTHIRLQLHTLYRQGDQNSLIQLYFV